MYEIENIIIDDDRMIIITADGNKRTLKNDSENQMHRDLIHAIILAAESLVAGTEVDISDDDDFNSSSWSDWHDDYGDVDDTDDDIW